MDEKIEIEITVLMIDVATEILNDSGVFEYEPLLGSNRVLVAEMLRKAISVGGFSPKIPAEFEKILGTDQNEP